MIRNTPGQVVGAELVDTTTGGAFVGTVTVYVTLDGTGQVIGSVGGGVCSSEGRGYYTYFPSQAETDGALIGFTFTATGAVPVTVQVATTPILLTSQPGRLMALDAIKFAFDTLGILQSGETLNPPDAADALKRLQWMLSQWRLQPGFSPTNIRESFPLVAGQGGPSNPYTVGPGGDFDTSRPMSVSEITGWALILGGTTPSVEIPRAMLTDDAFQAIPIKDLTNTLFTDAYYNPTYAGGLGTIILWPVPNTNVNTFVWYRNLPILNFTTLTASIDMPEGIEEAIVYNLALRLAAPYGKPISPDIVDLARTSLAWVKRMNTRLMDLPTDPALTQSRRHGYDINVGNG